MTGAFLQSQILAQWRSPLSESDFRKLCPCFMLDSEAAASVRGGFESSALNGNGEGKQQQRLAIAPRPA